MTTTTPTTTTTTVAVTTESPPTSVTSKEPGKGSVCEVLALQLPQKSPGKVWSYPLTNDNNIRQGQHQELPLI